MTAPPAAVVPATGARSARIEGLAAWRALLMLAGLPLHAMIGQQDYAPFTAIVLVSGSFRMGAFFMISGLLGGFSLMRQANPTRWLRRRLSSLGWPTLFGLAVIGPAIGLMDDKPQPFWPIAPYHIWFLLALLAYTVLGVTVHGLDRGVAIFAAVERRSHRARRLQIVLLLLVGLMSFTLMSVGCLIDAHASAALRPTTAHMAVILGYAPTFLLGFAAARAPTLWRMLTASQRVPLTILGVALAAHLLLRSPWLPSMPAAEWHHHADLLALAGAAWCPPAAAVLILRSAVAIRRVPPLLDRLADASFTIYMLHYPIIIATKALIGPLGWSVWADFAMSIATGGVLSYAAHRWIVAPTPILALLIAGRPLPTRTARATSAESVEKEGGELLLPGAPRTAGVPFCCPVGSDRAILE